MVASVGGFRWSHCDESERIFRATAQFTAQSVGRASSHRCKLLSPFERRDVRCEPVNAGVRRRFRGSLPQFLHSCRFVQESPQSSALNALHPLRNSTTSYCIPEPEFSRLDEFRLDRAIPTQGCLFAASGLAILRPTSRIESEELQMDAGLLIAPVGIRHVDGRNAIAC